ncbi:MAG: hypothetical protein KDB52_10470 [Solirubrobacterales bacterium]|nr:hypothetical protein [Solirubrobacterales bacterium]
MALAVLLIFLPAFSGCGSDDPDPADELDRVLTRENLSGFGSGPEGPLGGLVKVQALGFEDRVLEERQVVATPEVMSDIRGALGADSGLRELADDLEFEGTEQVAGVGTNHLSGTIDVGGLARALREAGADRLGSLAGVDPEVDLEETLTKAEFDLYSGEEDGTIRRLDLTLSLDDPDNALPATRIRFSLTPVSSGGTLQ